MNFFDDEDPFRDIVREFFGTDTAVKRFRNQVIKGEEEERVIDFIEDKNKIYLIFELPGYNEKDISIIIKGKELNIKITKKSNEQIQDYLIQKLNQGGFIKKILPKFINHKKFDYTMRNGILEISFNKK